MDKFDRIQQLHRLFLKHRKPIPLSTIADSLECTERNARRLIDLMHDWVGAPLEYDRQSRGWHYNSDDEFELPGLWLTSDELHSLSLLLDILDQFGNKSLISELQPVKNNIYKLLKSRGVNPSLFASHIKVLPIGNRQLAGKIFNRVSEALLHKQCLHIHYQDYKHKLSKRTVSPQNLIYYRENWYLDAWCHLRESLRTFSISRITFAEVVDEKTKSIDQKHLQEHLASSYGIFSGKGKHTARLRFSREIAREISMQQWHPEQQGEWDGDDYLLSFPYSSDKELLQDLLRHTPNVYVESPVKLRKTLQTKLQMGLERSLGRGLGWL
ncbi:MAG: transcriptional regulator [Alphaproteobacteria bacterium]|nr:MAG: transcriptional regulator [Alphaproteobacteria bacterium]